MANNLDVSLTFSASGTLENPLDASIPVDGFEVGSTWPSPSITFDTGVGSSQANNWFHDERTILTTVTDTIRLDGTGVTNGFGQTIDLSSGGGVVRVAIFQIDTPDGTKKLRVGPLADAAAFKGGITGTSTAQNAYKEFTHWEIMTAPIAGFTPGTYILINNPTGVTVTYWVWLLVSKTGF